MNYLKQNLDEYSALFIGGGNTYELLNELNQYDNYNKIETFLKNDEIVFGGSAGAIIFRKDIDWCLLDDENKLRLEDTKGFNHVKNSPVDYFLPGLIPRCSASWWTVI